MTDDFQCGNREKPKLKVISLDRNSGDLIDMEQPKITFADVCGLEKVKKKIQMNFILPLKQPELFMAFGKKAGGSMLLYGPPGCGKTFFARAIAGEINANFIHVELHDILSMYIGESQNNLHDIFEKARFEKPCVIFFDELDALGGSRHQMNSHDSRMIVNQLLVELDGIESNNSQLMVIGATNTPWYLDSALRRPGRFNHLFFVPPPEKEERVEILKLKLRNVPHESLALETCAELTRHFSGADLEQLVRDAVELALERSMEAGEIQPVNDKDMKTSLKAKKPTTLDWFATAKNYATFSDVNKDYENVLAYIKNNHIRG